MTYSDFVNSFSYGVTMFYNSFVSISSYLISNYFFITLLGIVFFSSLFVFIFNNFIFSLMKKRMKERIKKYD